MEDDYITGSIAFFMDHNSHGLQSLKEREHAGGARPYALASCLALSSLPVAGSLLEMVFKMWHSVGGPLQNQTHAFRPPDLRVKETSFLYLLPSVKYLVIAMGTIFF